MEAIGASMARWNATQLRPELPSGDDRTQLRFVAQEFESLFAKQMLDSMRATLNREDDLFDGGMAQDIFEDMLYEEYARMMSRTGSLGIADMIVRQYEHTVSAQVVNPERAASVYDSL